MDNKYGIALLPIIPVRKFPSEKSEMTSQLLFGDKYQILEISNTWLRILNDYDNYDGWICANQHFSFEHEVNNQISGSKWLINTKTTDIITPETEIMTITAGSTLHEYDSKKGAFYLGGQAYRLMDKNSAVLVNDNSKSATELCNIFLNSPYLWGGKSVFGCDCSGFIQTLHKLAGISLPRDTCQQATCGKIIFSIAEAVSGDLAFFGENSENITHVGLLLSPCTIIHCSGKVKVEKLDRIGIVNKVTGKYSHKLLLIKRILL